MAKDKETQANIKQLQDELVELMLKKAGIKKQDIYKSALKLWVSKNLDLLTPTELKRYKGIVIL